MQKASHRLQVRYKRGAAQLASIRHGNPTLGLRVIVVSGASGKTTTAALLTGLLREAGHHVELLVNRRVTYTSGVQEAREYQKPMQLQRLFREARHRGATIVVLEASEELIQSEALSAVPIDTVVVSAIDARTEGTIEKLLQYSSNYVVLPHPTKLTRANSLAVAEHQIITFGTEHDADAVIGVSRLYRKGTEVHVTIDHQTNFTLATYLIGSLNARNVAASIATAYVLGANTKLFEDGVAGLERVEGNYQYVDEGGVYICAIDGAPHPDSAVEVVTTARALTKRRLTVVLDGIDITDEHLEKIKSKCDRLIITASDSTIRIGVELAHDVKHAVDIALRGARKDDTVLLVGPAFAVKEADGHLAGESLVRRHG